MEVTTLSIVNEMLGLLGELPINDLDAFHPVVPRALATLNTANAVIQAKPWWFNTEYPTLVPQVGTNEIMLPADTLSVDSLTASPNVAQRGRRLYNATDSTYEFTAPVKCIISRLIPFDDLPISIRSYVGAEALLIFQNTIDGDQVKTNLLVARRQSASNDAKAENTRRRKSNMFNRPGIAYTLAQIAGTQRIRRI